LEPPINKQYEAYRQNNFVVWEEERSVAYIAVAKQSLSVYNRCKAHREQLETILVFAL